MSEIIKPTNQDEQNTTSLDSGHPTPVEAQAAAHINTVFEDTKPLINPGLPVQDETKQYRQHNYSGDSSWVDLRTLRVPEYGTEEV
jgi:hypothetical protein